MRRQEWATVLVFSVVSRRSQARSSTTVQPDYFFPDADVEAMVTTLRDITSHAVVAGEAS